MAYSMETRTLPVDVEKIGKVTAISSSDDLLDGLVIQLDPSSKDARNLHEAAQLLRSSDIPVAFPTETVYGLGADATRSAAVQGIYKAKQRPSDNPLIVHFASLTQLRSLLQSSRPQHDAQPHTLHTNGHTDDPIPAIYTTLISRFWPGPLTIILPNPKNSPLAPEVTAGLGTFGARMPKHVLALALIQLANVPIAAPSANASTKPSPTTAEHVLDDLNGRIQLILDGGPCDVGVESTVVDGLSIPPLVLRPGGISLEQIRSCPGWEDTQIGYKNTAEQGSQPRAPGMKYRHYSPKATVVLYEAGKRPPHFLEMQNFTGSRSKLGIIRTMAWTLQPDRAPYICQIDAVPLQNGFKPTQGNDRTKFFDMLQSLGNVNKATTSLSEHQIQYNDKTLHILDIELGPDTADIARGIFSALRTLDRHEVDAIIVEGINEDEGETAAAVMNRLRKAAEVRVEN